MHTVDAVTAPRAYLRISITIASYVIHAIGAKSKGATVVLLCLEWERFIAESVGTRCSHYSLLAPRILHDKRSFTCAQAHGATPPPDLASCLQGALVSQTGRYKVDKKGRSSAPEPIPGRG